MTRSSALVLRWVACVLLAAPAVLFAGPARADDWHTSLADGLAAAGKSGKPVLLVTLWPPNV
ncbi:MAG: hypothetical protein R3E85_01760 [Planctomycetota bacterium]